MIRILLADDQALIRSGIRSLLEAEDDIEVVAEAADGQHAVALAAEHRPDIALMDIQMPVLDGLEATRQIVAGERLDSVRAVVLTNFGLDEYIFRALRAGASGFLLKDTQRRDRRRHGAQPRHRQDPCQPGDDQARRPRRAQLVVFAYQTGLVTPRAAGQAPGH